MSVPRLRPGVRLHWDRVRQRHVLLAPERVVELDDIAKAILERIDGTTPLDAIIAALATEYDADPEDVKADTAELLADLRAKGYVAL